MFASMAHQNGGFKRFTHHFGPTKAQMRFVDHHLAHAISAYSYSGFDNAAVVVMDGRGAWEASSIWYGHDGQARSRAHDSVAEFAGTVLRAIHAISRICSQQR